jgi:hypothetical protein
LQNPICFKRYEKVSTDAKFFYKNQLNSDNCTVYGAEGVEIYDEKEDLGVY